MKSPAPVVPNAVPESPAAQRGGAPGGRTSLEIQLHLANGSVSRLKPEGVEAIQAILDHLHPERLFQQQHLILAERGAVTLYRWSAVTRIDLLTDRDFTWPYPANVLDWAELTAEEFSKRRRALPPRAEQRVPDSNVVEAIAEIEFSNGERLLSLLKLRVSPRLPVDQSMLLHRFLERPVLHCRRRGGGVLVMNPAHIVRLSAYPGPPADPLDAWHADRLGE